MKTAEQFASHIHEKGCHNCRHHYVNHKKCNSESPCKQGMEWKSIIPRFVNTPVDKLKNKIESPCDSCNADPTECKSCGGGTRRYNNNANEYYETQ